VKQATLEDPLLDWRSEFPTVESTLHFISHSLGAMPRGVEEELRRYAATWKSRGIRAWEEGWFELPTVVGDTLGRIIGSSPGSVSLHENCTTAHMVALSAVDFRAPRNRVVSTAEDFPSMLYLFEGLARRGAELVRVPARDGHAMVEDDIVRAIDERTAVVAISWVLFRTSQLLDLVPILRRAREVGALTMIDAYQAVGTVPANVTELGMDFMAGGSVKWMCGGPGGGWLYANPATTARLEPGFTGWMAHENPFAFDSGPTRRHEGPRRFWTGTPGVPSFLAARSGYEIIERIGVPAIRAKSLRQVDRMLALADEMGFRVVSPRAPALRGGTLVIDVPHADEVCRRLLDADVLLDHRPDVGLRLAPHFYTRDDECDLVMQKIREAAGKAG
jgi:kynureninase